MSVDDATVAEESLKKINRVCSVINVVLKAIFAIIILCWVLASGLLAASIVDPSMFDDHGGSSPRDLILFLIYGLLVAAMFIIFIRIFSDASKGESPFTMKQAKRLQIIAAFLVLYSVFDFVITANTSLLNIEGFDSGYFSTNENAIIPLNFAPLIAAAVVFAFSFVFKYGVLLQEFSDDTL